MIASSSEKAIGFHGEPGAGKTPLARTIAMAVSRHWIAKAGKTGEVMPSFRQACEFDFFRGQPGSVFRPDILDDGTLSEQQFQKAESIHRCRQCGIHEQRKVGRSQVDERPASHLLCQ